MNIVQLVVNTPIFYGRGNKTPTNMGGIYKDSAMPFRVTIDAQISIQSFILILCVDSIRMIHFKANKTV